MERHSLTTTPVEFHTAIVAGEANRLVGYAARFNEPIHPFFGWDEYTEYLDPNAFTRTLKDHPDVLAVRNHNLDQVLGRVSNHRLTLKVDKVGLYFELLMPNTTLGRDTYEDVASGNITGCSIGFFVPEDGDKEEIDNKAGTYKRTIFDLDLIEITPACTIPANPNAQAEARALIFNRSQPVYPTETRSVLDLPAIFRRRRGR